jgi:pimeloyl-ACP methyl ester carboxylesterase
MGARGRLIAGMNVKDVCARIASPVLVITGERALDRVVRVDSTLGYVSAIRHARAAELTGTGHIGYLTRPERFVTLVTHFLATVGTLKHDAA